MSSASLKDEATSFLIISLVSWPVTGKVIPDNRSNVVIIPFFTFQWFYATKFININKPLEGWYKIERHKIRGRVCEPLVFATLVTSMETVSPGKNYVSAGANRMI